METMKLKAVFHGVRGVAFAFVLAAPFAAGCAAEAEGGAPEGGAAVEVAAEGGDDVGGELVGEASSAISEYNSEWRVEGAFCTPGTVCTLTGSSYVGLKNTYINQFVVYGERDYGINLVWRTGSNPGNVRFIPGAGGAINYEQPVSLFVANPSSQKYVRYGERDYGINLVWSTSPSLEWRITGGTPGTPVDFSKPFGLRNTAQTHVVYCPREYGINLRWNSDCPFR